ncbi:MAG: glycoside hydrolase family 3 N-terminal domain-containing protein [Bacteroidota bacterium]
MKNALPFVIILLLFNACNQPQQSERDVFVSELISNMTLAEKIGQMSQINITEIIQDSIVEDYANVTHYVIDTAKLEKYLGEFHIGSFLNGRSVSAENWHYVTSTIQSINQKYSDVPIIYGIDHVHGASYLKPGTIFPHNINVASTFDTRHAFNTGNVAAYESADLGHKWIFAPVLGLGVAKWWGRYYETFGEDPYLISQMGLATIAGIQDDATTAPHKTAACAKHFLGYSDPKSGWDRAPALIPDQTLREFFLPPFRDAIDAGVKTIMLNSGEINGIPVHASYEILTTLLRDEMGFEGFTVTDWLDIIALEKMHYVAENEKEATYMAIQAGVDMSMIPTSPSFCILLKELVEEGRISEARIDESVRRILNVKYDIGLFDIPIVENPRFERVGTEENIQKAKQAADESMVLIKNNNNLLPLSKSSKVLLAGPNAKNKIALCGGWTYRFAPQKERWFPEDMPTVHDALESVFGDSYAFANYDQLAVRARNSDVIVLALGETRAYAETQGTIDDLTIDKEQTELFKAAKATGKPVVVLLIEGRPRLIPDIVDEADAILFAGLPGIYGAESIAEVLAGDINPSGKMSFSYPYKHGHIIPYNYKQAEFSELREVSDALKRHTIAPFGYGLSYTTYEYSDLKADATEIGVTQKLIASVTVKNTGDRVGKESVLWFISDEYGTITRPVKELRHFEKIELEPGQSKTVTFEVIPAEDLSYPDKHGKEYLEPGDFRISVGDQEIKFKLN